MKALYIGSFDPFTNGHYDVLKQAEELFDDIVIVIAENPSKKRRFDMIRCSNAIETITKHNIVYSSSLTTDIMNYYECDYLIRGLRNTTDYLYEEALIKQYRMLKPDIKVVYFRASTDISSSFIYELYKRNKDVSPYVPYDKKYLDALYYLQGKFKEDY
jgi:pantetheine-phosphate adenylyltransferase